VRRRQWLFYFTINSLRRVLVLGIRSAGGWWRRRSTYLARVTDQQPERTTHPHTHLQRAKKMTFTGKDVLPVRRQARGKTFWGTEKQRPVCVSLSLSLLLREMSRKKPALTHAAWVQRRRIFRVGNY